MFYCNFKQENMTLMQDLCQIHLQASERNNSQNEKQEYQIVNIVELKLHWLLHGEGF